MSSGNTTYSLSVNTGIKDKPDRTERVDFARNFRPIEATLEDIIGHVSRGHAIAPQYKDGHRRGANFIKSGFIAADVDDGMSLEDARNHAMVRHHAGLIHTTASHTAERHRLRIIFPLDKAILDAQDLADAQLGLAVALGSDRSVSDAGRMFFGSSGGTFFRISKSTPPHVVADLIARGRDARTQKSGPKDSQWPVNSSRRMGPGALVKVATGDLCRMDELKVGVSVHCPYHEDANPSAFVVNSNSIGIHCSACKVTFWTDDNRDSYDFDAFERLFDQRRLAEEPSEEDQLGFERFFPPRPRFERLKEKYLPPLDYHPGITLVRSQKGSGKTEALVSLLEFIRAGSFPATIHKKDRPRSVLLIGHRRTLLREAAAKLGMRCYLDAEYPTEDLVTLAVCLDSLPKYGKSFPSRGGKPGWRRKGPFDLIIIDEVEQVLKHLLSETIEKRAGLDRCFDALSFEVANAKAVFVLDADLGLLTAHAMRVMRHRDWQENCRIIYNEPIIPAQKRTMRLFRDRKRLEREVLEAIRRGERCFITSNSKEFILNAERMIRDVCGSKVIMRVVTGDNSHEEAVVGFVKNIKTEFLKVQVVLTTPSMGTGIDISFPGGECRVDRSLWLLLFHGQHAHRHRPAALSGPQSRGGRRVDQSDHLQLHLQRRCRERRPRSCLHRQASRQRKAARRWNGRLRP